LVEPNAEVVQRDCGCETDVRTSAERPQCVTSFVSSLRPVASDIFSEQRGGHYCWCGDRHCLCWAKSRYARGWVCVTSTDVLLWNGTWVAYTGEPYSGSWWSPPNLPNVDQYGSTWSTQILCYNEPRVTLACHYHGPDYAISNNPEWPSATRYRATYDFTTLVRRDTYSLTISGAQGTDGIAIAPNRSYTFTVDYAGYMADTTPPDASSVIAWGDDTATTLSARRSASDPESAITRKGGSLTLIGNVTPRVELGLQSIVFGEIAVRGTCASSGEFPDCVALVASGRIIVDPLITEHARLEDGQAVFDGLYQGAEKSIRTVFLFD